MFEKVNPSHPDKIADRIAGAIVDLAYRTEANPKIAVEVLLGHGQCHIIIETSAHLLNTHIDEIVDRIAGPLDTHITITEQDKHLANNQIDTIRCGDNGIFRGVPTSDEELELSEIAKEIYFFFPSDGKYIIDDEKLIICQSMAPSEKLLERFPSAQINPLGDWTGGLNVDSGATNRKLGSDMGRAVTGGGLHGKDLSKADVSVNIYAHLKAQNENRIVEFSCAIGDEIIDGKPYHEIVDLARDYIQSVGGFEKFAEWGLV